MEVMKTIQGGVVTLTKVKQELLGQEYENLQRYLHGEEDKEYPLSIRKGLIDVQECDSDVCDYFVKIPVAGRYGGVNVPVNTHEEIKEDYELCESKLYREDGTFSLNITVKQEVAPVATVLLS